MATVAAVALARRAVECFGRRELVLTGFVPKTDGLGGTDAAEALPGWLAGGFTGAILQSAREEDPAAHPWFGVKVAPSIGACAVTGEADADCPFAPYVGSYVAVAGHFDDPAATTCRSRARTPGGYAGPPKAAMVDACRREFVVTALGPATGP